MLLNQVCLTVKIILIFPFYCICVLTTVLQELFAGAAMFILFVKMCLFTLYF